jgi:MFS family permease
MVVMSIGQVAEIVTMVILGAVLARLGWKWTMVLGIIGHMARFAVFAYFPDVKGLIIAIQLLHGICYAFFFATVYIFVDAVFPKDVRSSAQGLFNLLILGVGMVLAGSVFPELKAAHTAGGVTDWRGLFLIPTGLAAGAVVLMALFFHPPSQRPEEAGSAP